MHYPIVKLVTELGFKEGMKEGSVLFSDTLNTLYLQLYGIRQRERKPAVATRATLSD